MILDENIPSGNMVLHDQHDLAVILFSAPHTGHLNVPFSKSMFSLFRESPYYLFKSLITNQGIP